MKEKFYYLKEVRENGFHRKGIVFLVQDEEGNIGKGIAFCHPDDSFRKTTVGNCKDMLKAVRGRQLVSEKERDYFEECKNHFYNGKKLDDLVFRGVLSAYVEADKNGNCIVKPIIGGINRARGRALRALRRKADTSPIGRKEVIEFVEEEYKSIYNPALLPYELRMIKDWEEFDPEPELSETTVV